MQAIASYAERADLAHLKFEASPDLDEAAAFATCIDRFAAARVAPPGEPARAEGQGLRATRRH